nr:hypothetical protein [Tanacetum cinerariifolium]
RAHRTPTLTTSPQGKKRKHSAGESSSPHKSLKITTRQQKVVEEEKYDDDYENRLKPESHKDNPKYVDDDDDKYAEKVDKEEGGETSSLETRTEETQTPIFTKLRSPRIILSSHKNISQELTDTVRFAGCVDVKEVLDLVSQEFNAQAPKIIEDIFKNYVQSNVIQVHPTTTTSIKTTSSADLQQQLYFKMKRSLQDRANDLALWEKQQQEWDAWVEETIIDEDEVILKDETFKLITELQDVDKRVPTIFDYERMKATLNDALSK